MGSDKLKILPFLFLILLASACHKSGPVNRELRLADSIMEENPDTAMYVLQRISNPEVMPADEYAMYCLLTTQAADMNKVQHTSDELISFAVKHFSESSDNSLKAKANYYMARVQEDLGNTAEAEKYYLLAISTLERTKEYKQTGMFYTTLSELYQNNSKFTESRDAQQKAYNNYLLAVKQENQLHPAFIVLPVLLIGILLVFLIRYQLIIGKEKKLLHGQEKKLVSAQQVIEKQRTELTHLKKEISSIKKSLYNSSPIMKKIKKFNDIPVTSKEKPVLTEQEWSNFLEILDDTYGFVTSLRQSYHKLTDVDVRICALLREGVSTLNISTLMNMTPETLSRRIQRIRNDKMNQGKSSRPLELILKGMVLNT